MTEKSRLVAAITAAMYCYMELEKEVVFNIVTQQSLISDKTVVEVDLTETNTLEDQDEAKD